MGIFRSLRQGRDKVNYGLTDVAAKMRNTQKRNLGLSPAKATVAAVIPSERERSQKDSFLPSKDNCNFVIVVPTSVMVDAACANFSIRQS